MKFDHRYFSYIVLLFATVTCLFVPRIAIPQDPKGPTANPNPKSNIKTFLNCPNDLVTPKMTEGLPSAGKRTRQQLDRYKNSDIFHALYLPTDYEAGQKYPVIFEFAGNGPFENRLGDKCSGKIEDCNLGFGISGGKGFIWVCVPFVSHDGKSNQLQWWGDVDASVEYCKQVVELICSKYGGERKQLFLCGFSRGAIGCNYVGLHDDEIAGLWCGMICHSHYDGVRRWNYPGSDIKSAKRRLNRLKSIPQFICQENSVAQIRAYLKQTGVAGNFTFLKLPFANHTDQWVLKDLPERQTLRDWLKKTMAK